MKERIKKFCEKNPELCGALVGATLTSAALFVGIVIGYRDTYVVGVGSAIEDGLLKIVVRHRSGLEELWTKPLDK